ncbi:MAG: amidase [Phycisphaerae bacterium]|nr:amidase [Gemmatimonadaceae bacterium]
MSILERDSLNAFTRHTHVAMPGANEGPLARLTFGLKDIYDIAGHRTGFGSPDWLATHAPAVQTGTVVTRLLKSGASLVGKTHTEEMAFSLSGENAHYGTPVNPAAPGRVPGGSSSGSAAAVAGGLVDFAIGSDTGGSVRGPASFCGVFGIRPTHGRISLDGVLPLAPSFDTCGWFARDAATLLRVAEVLLDGRPKTPGRLLVATDAFALAVPGALAALKPAIEHVAGLLGKPDAVQLSENGLAAWYEVMRVLQFGEIHATHGAWVARERPKFGPEIQPRFDAVAKSDPVRIAASGVLREDIRERMNALLADNAVLLLPTMPDIAPYLNDAHQQVVAFRERALPMLCIAGLCGLPQISLPMATLDGCPLGLSMMAAPGNDEMLLELACRVAA